MDGTSKIETLKGLENYFSWQIQVQDILTAAKLVDYLLGNEKVSTDTMLLAAWRIKNRSALSMICLRCSSAVVIHIADSTTSKDTWNTLQNTYTSVSVTSKIMLLKRLQRVVIAEGANMELTIHQLSQLHQQYNKMGGLMTDEEFSQTILAALSSSWDSLINSIQTTVSSAEVIGCILSEELRRTEREAVSTSTALIAKGAAEPTWKSKFRKSVFYYNCDKEGHIKADCCSAKIQTSSNNSASSGSYTYVVKLATNLYAFASGGGTPTFAKRGETWLGDTATEHHIVCDCTVFVTYNATPGSTIMDVSGSCATLG